jgi:hypothetical protein
VKKASAVAASRHQDGGEALLRQLGLGRRISHSPGHRGLGLGRPEHEQLPAGELDGEPHVVELMHVSASEAASVHEATVRERRRPCLREKCLVLAQAPVEAVPRSDVALRAKPPWLHEPLGLLLDLMVPFIGEKAVGSQSTA